MMISVKEIDDSTKDIVTHFLKSVPSIECIDDNILNNAVVALEDSKVLGCISFEVYGNKGLIRYFVFKKMLNDDVLNSLIDKLKDNGYKYNLDMFVCIAENIQIEELFSSLGFIKIESNLIFINEDHIKRTNFKNSSFLCKDLTY